MSGAIVFVSGCPVYWHTKRQRIVSKASTIADYLATDDAVEEARWIQMLLNTLLKVISTTPIPTMIDNKSTIKCLTNGNNSEAPKTADCKFLPFGMQSDLENSFSSTAPQTSCLRMV
ncbi:putative reverse transcriptase Ty1/copia-type domain-containing protein [Phytophthora infestans]|uniref:Putative reverse transcriptase Ty1/copia-type domain-containing protein n=1 Tax=Phytophthora infestans TaxID=4787 RepID=A0A8S9UKM4_PHYIN|nr:putative reverse transcriptase Ty1/copia-type domain-containing protein [Phytophthora infestans]